jgi:hypothetical protein
MSKLSKPKVGPQLTKEGVNAYSKPATALEDYIATNVHGMSHGSMAERRRQHFGTADPTLVDRLWDNYNIVKALKGERWADKQMAAVFSSPPKASGTAPARGGAVRLVKPSHRPVERSMGPVKIENSYGNSYHKLPQMARQNMGKLVKARAPVSQSVTVKPRPYIYKGGDTFTISHREFLGNVVSSGSTFNIENFLTVQPGDPACFPWLAPLAGRFEQYRLKSLVAHYIPTVPSSTAGSVMLAFDKNAARSTPATKLQLLEYQDSSKSSVWTENSLVVKGPWPKLYTLLGNNYSTPFNPANSANNTTMAGFNNVDIKTYAAGVLWVASEGVSAGTVGEVFLEYELELIRPGVFSNAYVNTTIEGPPKSTTVMFGTGTAYNMFGSSHASVTGDNVVVFDELPAGSFCAFLNANGLTGADSPGISFSVPTGYTLTQTSFLNQGNPYMVASSSSDAMIMYSFQLPQPAQVTMTIAGFSHLSTSGTAASLRVFSYDVPNFG